jgi:uncharacterized membrane protein YqiK
MNPALIPYTVLTVLVIAFLTYTFSRLVIIPPNNKAIVERLGKFSRVINSGWWILSPFENLKTVEWRYMEEVHQGDESVIVTKYYVTQLFKSETIHLDLPPINVITKEKLPVDVNVSCSYRIKDLCETVYHIDQPLSNMQELINQAIRYVVSTKCFDELYGNDYNLSSEILDQIKPKLQKLGFVCETLTFQSINANKEVIDAINSRYLELGKFSHEKLKHECDHNNKLKFLEMEKERQRMHHELEIQNSKSQYLLKQQNLEAQLLESNHELKIKEDYWNCLLKKGATPEHIVHLEYVNKFATTIPRSSTVFIPSGLQNNLVNFLGTTPKNMSDSTFEVIN